MVYGFDPRDLFAGNAKGVFFKGGGEPFTQSDPQVCARGQQKCLETIYALAF